MKALVKARIILELESSPVKTSIIQLFSNSFSVFLCLWSVKLCFFH